MNLREFKRGLIEIFGNKTSCYIQYAKCPCNSCFHAIDDVDFRHITWLILLALRGDYTNKRGDILEDIRKELEIK